MSRPSNPIDVNAITRRIDVDNRLSLRYYYRTADTLLRQADIYRSEKNVVDLYVILLRYSSLVSETIPFHRDYHTVSKKERKLYREKLLAVLDELESLKPEFQRQTEELNKAEFQRQSLDRSLYGPQGSLWDSHSPFDNNNGSATVAKQLLPANQIPQSSWKQNDDYSQRFSNSNDLDRKFQTISLSIPRPKQETLSRHSFLGQNGLRGQWQGPSAATKISYPSQADFISEDYIGNRNQDEEKTLVSVKDGDFGRDASNLEAVLSLDDGRWSNPVEESYPSHPMLERNQELLPLGNLRQPNPPPVLAQVHPDVHAIPPSRVADPRPGPAQATMDGMKSSNTYQNLHIPVKLMEDFLRLAQTNTRKNLETCAILAGSLKNRVFHITTLIIPKQESTSDSCQTLNEEEIFEVQDKLSLFPLGWIHTHPTQTCFMSSVDLHTHYSYQIMLPEAIAIVMAPTDSSSPHGIFHLSDPGGVKVIRNCQERGFHPHEEPSDGSPLYEHCSHVYMNPNVRFDVIDLR